MVQKPPKGIGAVPYLLHQSFATLFWGFRMFLDHGEGMVHTHRRNVLTTLPPAPRRARAYDGGYCTTTRSLAAHPSRRGPYDTRQQDTARRRAHGGATPGGYGALCRAPAASG